MFWADRIAVDIKKKYSEQIGASEPLVIRDEKTASGRIHVGSMRGVAIHGALSEVLTERDIANTFYYEINDFDAFDSVPAYVNESFSEYLGKPLFAVPAPEEGAKNYAEYFGEEFASVIKETGFSPTFYYSSTAYREEKFNEVIRTALERADEIREIYKRVSGGERPEGWLPIMMICEDCGKVATTRAVSFDGERVTYVCDQEGSGATGCGNGGDASPFDGNAKLPWKVEWAAKFKVFNVTIEGEGKDLATKGGARDVSDHIAREVFDYAPPYDIPYEFFLVGGKKMSASKGTGSSAREIADLMPPHLFRFTLLERDIKKAINFDPSEDAIPTLYSRYDVAANEFWTSKSEGLEDNLLFDRARLFTLSHKGNPPEEEFFLPNFTTVSFLIQMPHLNLYTEMERIKEGVLNKVERKELDERARYARHWLDTYAPEAYRFELQDTLPEAARSLSDEQKKALSKLHEHIESVGELDGQELHTALHDIRKELDIEPKAFFSAIYLVFLGKDHGPKAGWFLSVLERDFLLRQLKEAIS